MTTEKITVTSIIERNIHNFQYDCCLLNNQLFTLCSEQTDLIEEDKPLENADKLNELYYSIQEEEGKLDYVSGQIDSLNKILSEIKNYNQYTPGGLDI